MVKELFKVSVIFLFITSCVSKGPAPVKAEKPKTTPVYTESTTEVKTPPALIPEAAPSALNTQTPTPGPISQAYNVSDIKGVPRIGIIFSGGGAKAWAHIGVIKEIEKAKWPIRAVAGVEWGAAIAGVYANQLSSNEVEWELLKVKDFDDLEKISETLFDKKSVNDLKVPFVCPSLNISKQEIYLLNRGQLSKLMPFCLAHPPLSKPYKQSVAEMDNVGAVAQHLRSTGVKKIVLINVLAQNNKKDFVSNSLSAENILWVKSAVAANKKTYGVDDIIQINLDDYDIDDIDKKREIIAKGSELSYDQVVKLTQKYGL